MKKRYGKISAQPHSTLCIQFLNRENNDKNTLPLGKQICFTIVQGCAETLPKVHIKQESGLYKKWEGNQFLEQETFTLQ